MHIQIMYRSDSIFIVLKKPSFITRIAVPGILALLAVSGCATQAFSPSPVESAEFIQRGISKLVRSVEVTAAVPSAEETRAIFGVDLYADGTQPVWLRVENRGNTHARVALFSIDENYFSPLEIAWQYRKKFRSSDRDELERWFVSIGLPRHIPAGESRSGYVFTHATEGTKGFNVDVFSDFQSMQFTFFVPLPGFRPDYMDVDFQSLYAEEEIIRTDQASLRAIIDSATCCTANEAGQLVGDPLNIVIVGTPVAIRRSLLRGGWQEPESKSPLTRVARDHYYQGRPPDGTFYISRPDGLERKELRLWLTPILVDDETSWIGHISYDMSGTLLTQDPSNYRIDPDVDAARMFLMQNFWYNQSLRAIALAAGVPPATIDAPRSNFREAEYFTDGRRIVLFISETPIDMGETEIIFWESPVDD
jgi:hypothetical protein